MTEIEKLNSKIASLQKEVRDSDVIVANLLAMMEASLPLVRLGVQSEAPGTSEKTTALLAKWEDLLAAVAAGRMAAAFGDKPSTSIN